MLRAVRYMNGAMQPGDFLEGYSKADWLDFALLSEGVENELKSEKQADNKFGKGTQVFKIQKPPPDEGEGGVPMEARVG